MSGRRTALPLLLRKCFVGYVAAAVASQFAFHEMLYANLSTKTFTTFTEDTGGGSSASSSWPFSFLWTPLSLLSSQLASSGGGGDGGGGGATAAELEEKVIAASLLRAAPPPPSDRAATGSSSSATVDERVNSTTLQQQQRQQQQHRLSSTTSTEKEDGGRRTAAGAAAGAPCVDHGDCADGSCAYRVEIGGSEEEAKSGDNKVCCPSGHERSHLLVVLAGGSAGTSRSAPIPGSVAHALHERTAAKRSSAAAAAAVPVLDVCIGQQPNGRRCSADWFCSSNLCLKGVCRDYKMYAIPKGKECSPAHNDACEGGVPCALEREDAGTTTTTTALEPGARSTRAKTTPTTKRQKRVCCPSEWSRWSEPSHEYVCEGGQRSGGYCSEDAFCASGLMCIAGTCRNTKLPAGSPCDRDDDCDAGACAPPYETSPPNAETICCSSGARDFSNRARGYACERGQRAGGFCTVDHFCIGGNFCIDNACSSDSVVKGAGERCGDDFHCANGACGHPIEVAASKPICCPSGERGFSHKLYDYVCLGGQPTGSACSEDKFCSSGVCIGRLCRAAAASVGEVCDNPNHCTNNACGRDREESKSPSVCCPSGDYEWSTSLDDFVCTTTKGTAR